MMLIGRITKAKSPWWLAECDSIGAVTQGRSRKDAMFMLADCIETLVDRPDFKVTISELAHEGTDERSVLIDANEFGLLAAEVLKCQRERHRLTVDDVVSKLGASSRSAHIRYEQGRTEPSLSKFREILGIVAPEMAVGPRTRKRRTRRA